MLEKTRERIRDRENGEQRTENREQILKTDSELRALISVHCPLNLDLGSAI